MSEGMKYDLISILETAHKKGASDIHISVGVPPVLRYQGDIIHFKLDPLSARDTRKIIYSSLNEKQKHILEDKKDIDFVVTLKSGIRCRGNAFFQKGFLSAVFRIIPNKIPKLDTLGLPKAAENCWKIPNGLILVTGPTGSGKTTTISSFIDMINRNCRSHIITLEDPIEYVHKHEKSIVNQRFVGKDTENYSTALKYLLRQDPDICMMGELRDLETIETALRVAETGHLVFGTLHTNSAISTIQRILSYFPPDSQDNIRQQLSLVLKSILSQQLLPSKNENKMVLISEYLKVNSGIASMIREGKLHQIYNSMQLQKDKTGMMTINQSLVENIKNGSIDIEQARMKATNKQELEKILEEMNIKKAG